MNNDIVVSKLSSALALLNEAQTIQDKKKILDMAVAAEVYARRQKISVDLERKAVYIKIEALRQIGDMLKETPRNEGAKGIGKSVVQKENRTPTLSDLGLDKKTSKLAQDVAALPQEQIERVKSGVATIREAQREFRDGRKKEELEREMDKMDGVPLDDMCDLRVCSCEELFASGIRPDAVITDPPYPYEFLPVFSELARACASANVPLVAVMSGQSYLPEVMQRLCEHLTYRWTMAYLTPGGQAVQQWPSKVNTFWKPVLLFGESSGWIGDVCKSSVNDNDKRFHNWGQSESGMVDLIEKLTKPGQTICDPFLGGGTTAVVSIALGRKFIGCDISEESVKKTSQRVKMIHA